VLKSVAFAIDLYLHELSGELNVLRFIGSSPSVGKVNARARILLKILKRLLVDSDNCYWYILGLRLFIVVHTQHRRRR
jgi:hypothetical protein